VALRLLALPDAGNPSVLSGFNLRSASLLADACREQKPEFLVLQIGNEETLPKFEKIFRLFGGSTLGSSSPHIRPYVPDPGMQYQPTLVTRFIGARRLVLAALFTALGQGARVFNPAALAASLDEVLSSLRGLPLKAVLLLSPFSCPEPLARACRRQAAPIFAAAAQKHGCIFVDTFGLLESSGGGEAFLVNFADSCHLSRIGHERVGRLLGESLRHAMEAARNRPENPPLKDRGALD
jgi:hypothetical protein